jgi:hypothetical protein
VHGRTASAFPRRQLVPSPPGAGRCWAEVISGARPPVTVAAAAGFLQGLQWCGASGCSHIRILYVIAVRWPPAVVAVCVGDGASEWVAVEREEAAPRLKQHPALVVDAGAIVRSQLGGLDAETAALRAGGEMVPSACAAGASAQRGSSSGGEARGPREAPGAPLLLLLSAAFVKSTVSLNAFRLRACHHALPYNWTDLP